MKSKKRVLAGPANPSWGDLEKVLGHTFRNPDLLTLALTHSSWVFETQGSKQQKSAGQDNEQLEFVGDAALGLLAAESLYRRFPGASEGELTRMRASVVSRRHLGEVGGRLGLGPWLRLGHTAEMNGSRERPSLCSDAMEALIAALYLDGGLEAARQFVEREVLGPALPGLLATVAAAADAPRSFNGSVGDYKTALQELLRAAGRGQPEYRLIAESGPDHLRSFSVEVHVTGEMERGSLGAGGGSSKKQAQQEAAHRALLHLSTVPGNE